MLKFGGTKIPDILSRGVAEVLPSAEGLAQRMEKGRIRLYLGIDPTGPLLTLGHAVVLRKLQQFADLGHQVILLVGNGTVRIGDPTGKDTTRPVLTDDVIEANFQNWKNQASKILDFDRIELRHNGDWLDKLTYSDMIKIMAQTTVQQLVERDMFQERLKKNQPIFGHEIMYPLLQGYDSVAMDVDLEIGGTDQTFNMMMGRQLQKSYNNHEKWVLTTPIINGTDGRKMSKSFGNFIALTDPANDMFGKLMSLTDDQIVPYFTVLTDVPLTEISEMAEAMHSGANPMPFKKKLAQIITSWLHNSDSADAAQLHFENTVQQKQIPADLPVIMLSSNKMTTLELLKTCLPEESGTNLRRLVSQGSVEFLPGELKPTQADTPVDLSQVEIVRVGKRRYFKLEHSARK